MKRFLLALALCLLPSLASAQCNGVFSAHTICGNPNASAGIPGQVSTSVLTGIPGGSPNQIQYNNAGAFGGFTMVGDCTVTTSTGIEICTKTNGVAFGPLATATTPYAAITDGHLIANATGGSAAPVDTVPTTWFDHAFCSTIGQIVARTTSAWVCAQGIPADVRWFGAVCNNSTDDRLAIIAAIAALPAGATLEFPATKCAVKSLTGSPTNPHIFVLTQAIHLWFPNGGGISKSTVVGILFDIQTDGVTIDGTPTAIIDGGWATTLYTAFDIAVSTNDYDTASTVRNFIKISDVQFTNWAHGGVFAFYFNNFSIQNISVNNVAYAGIFCGACQFGQIVNNRVSNIWASTGPDIPSPNPVQYGNKYGISVSTNLAVSTPPINVVIANNVVSNVPTWECYDAHSGQNIVFSGNIGINCRAGIAISSPSALDSTDVKIDGNKITCIPLGSAIYNGSSGLSVGGAGISAVGLSAGNLGARLSIQNNIVSGCGPDNTTLEGTIGAIFVSLFVGVNIQGNVVYNPIYRAFNFGDWVWANVQGNWIENVTAGPAAAGAFLFDIQGADEKLNFGENSADGGGSYVGYNVTAQNAGFQVGVSRSNQFLSGGSLTLYNGGTQANRTDLGASAQ